MKNHSYCLHLYITSKSVSRYIFFFSFFLSFFSLSTRNIERESERNETKIQFRMRRKSTDKNEYHA